NATSCRRMDASRSPAPKLVENQSTMPVKRSKIASSKANQKKSFCPPLYFPTLGSSPENFKYSISLGPNQPRSASVIFMSACQCVHITMVATKKAQATQGCSQRQTCRPPMRFPIQLKMGDQMGMPVK